VIELCKRQKLCTYCGNYNGTVKKTTGALKIIHERYDKKKNEAMHEAYKETFSEAIKYNEGLRPHLHKVADDLNPLRVQALFEAVPDEDVAVLDITGLRPEHLVISHMAVPPVCIRPSVEMDGASNEDDITMKIMQIIEVNNVLRSGLEKGLPITNLMENWDFLQVQCAMLVNSELPGLPAQYLTPGRPQRGFVQRLKGKQGRFRGNLSGKRVDFSGRTVISPDPNLQINQVCVPQHMAVVLTYPERVTPHNRDKLKQRIINGPSTWPGANFVNLPNADRIFLKFGDRRRIATELKATSGLQPAAFPPSSPGPLWLQIGSIVERHLEDGDVILFNRQPSLHRISIMAFRAKVRLSRTLRFNECACRQEDQEGRAGGRAGRGTHLQALTAPPLPPPSPPCPPSLPSPFNADFDGDEMNLHLPQTEEARAEAINLMGSVANLTTPKNGEIMISATQDFLTCAYLVTVKDRFFTRAEMCLLSGYMTDACERVELPHPALMKPLELWTGKQLFSMLIRPNAQTRIFLNIEIAEKIYTKKGLHMCPSDGYVAFRNSELICGRIGKVVLGGSKGGLFGTLHHDYSSATAAAVMSRLAKMAARHMGNRGFSIGIDDVTPRPVLQREKAATINTGYSQCDGYIAAYKKGELELSPGCNQDQSLEANVMGVLNNIREQAGSVCMATLHWHNSPLIMSQCGSKGSPINIAQMVACVGQQSVGGKRAFNGFTDRTLPHYPRGDKTPAGKGFVANSFYSGLSATEFWFHTMGGREGLVDTAVKTAETGYMSRRLMKALEDLYTHYDVTVRNAAGGIVQLLYGDDGMDPVVMEGGNGTPMDLDKLLMKVRATTRRKAVAEGGQTEVPLPTELAAAIAAQLGRKQLSESAAWCSSAFRDSLRTFLNDQAERYAAARKRLGLEGGQRGLGALEYAAGQEGLTRGQLTAFMDRALAKYELKRIDPGSTVGAVGAQSIGEPGTQMTLKTFHFAGVASMNVTLGVPRIKEIINGAKNISTPIMKVALAVDNDVKAARIVKGRLERTLLGQVCLHIRKVLRPSRKAFSEAEAAISVRLDMAVIQALQLEIDANVVKDAILAHPRIKLKEQHVRPVAVDKLLVYAPDDSRQALLFSMEALLLALPKVIVTGIPSVERAVISKEKAKGGKAEHYMLLVEGTDLRRVMATAGVRGAATTTNHVHEIERYLGIEAARLAIMQEIQYTMSSHGMSIDNRHTMLLADCMTYKGEVMGITRFGIAKMKDSVLHTASFEKTSDHLFDAAIHGRCDAVTGVSESIIMGIPMPTGTGLFRLRHNVGQVSGLTARPAPVLAY
ncbi:hypothetical protein QJQ45_025764, partial [Haematococcus lacustris]